MNNNRANIARVNGHNYWLVRFFKRATRKATVLENKTFSDKKYGSKEASLDAAIKWRDDTANAKSYQLATRPNKHKAKTSRKTNTGMVGVNCRPITRIGETGITYIRFYYVVTWMVQEDGKRRQKAKLFRFEPDDKEGKKTAFKRAKEHRLKMLERCY